MVGEWIPIVGILTAWIGTAVVIGIVLYFNYMRRKTQSREIMAAIEKGIEIPFPPLQRRNYLNLGLIWTFVGVAFTLALWFSSERMEAAAWGFLPLAVGLAFLLIALFESKKGEEEQTG
jgi:dolichol kinase